jgi:hypothetical protein
MGDLVAEVSFVPFLCPTVAKIVKHDRCTPSLARLGRPFLLLSQ